MGSRTETRLRAALLLPDSLVTMLLVWCRHHRRYSSRVRLHRVPDIAVVLSGPELTCLQRTLGL